MPLNKLLQSLKGSTATADKSLRPRGSDYPNINSQLIALAARSANAAARLKNL